MYASRSPCPPPKVNESLYDTALILSSMSSALVARVGPHSDVADLAKYSSVPVINALSDLYHPMQTLADYLTIHEAFPTSSSSSSSISPSSLGLEGLRIAWVGDANNVLFDLAIGAMKLGVDIAVATPEGYGIPGSMRQIIQAATADAPTPGKLSETQVPEEAIKSADIIITDTWVSMGQEEEAKKRMKAFSGWQITSDIAKRGGAKDGWRFMHCLPRHPEEVSNEIFYGPRSLVFQEGENRLWSAIGMPYFFVLLQMLTAQQRQWKDLSSIRAKSSSGTRVCKQWSPRGDKSSRSVGIYNRIPQRKSPTSSEITF